MRILGVGVAYALSPQAKGKVERAYRWLQGRIVRTGAIEKLVTIDEARAVLKEEVETPKIKAVNSTAVNGINRYIFIGILLSFSL
jgi:hypothetical protein